MAIQTRKINSIARLASLVYASDKSYRHSTGKLYCRPVRAYHVVSPNSDTPYQVKWQLTKENDIVTFKVEMWTYSGERHISSISRVITDLMKGAIKAAARSEGKTISFCKTFEAAVKLLNFGGTLVQIRNMGNGVAWGVVR